MNKKLKYDPFGNTLVKKVKKTGIEDVFTRQTFVVRKEYVKKIKFRAYWDRITQKEILDKILKNYFKDKNIKPMPGR